MAKENEEKHLFSTKSKIEGLNLIQQVGIAVVICLLSFFSFLPCVLKLELYADEPDAPYTGGANDVLVDIINAVTVGSSAIMLLEALLDSNTLYIPIKISLPRFIMVLGVLFSSLVLYVKPSADLERLNILICSHYAKIYFICAGIYFRLLQDAVEQGGCRWIIYAFGATLYTAELLLRQWGAYYRRSEAYIIVHNCITICGLLFGLYFILRAVYLFRHRNYRCDNYSGGHRYYDLMSHIIICVFVFGMNIVNISFGYQSWLDTSSAEIAGYTVVGLFASVLFFFTSSYIAQRHFVLAKVFIPG